MSKRFVTALVLNLAAFAILYYSTTYVGSIIFLLAADLIIAVGLYEFYTIVEKKGSTSLMVFGMVAGVLYCTIAFITSENPVQQVSTDYFNIGLFVIIIAFFIFQYLRRDNSSVIHNFGGTLAGMVYVAWLLSFAVKINYYPKSEDWGGWYLVMLILAVKGGDAMAYFVGTRYGRVKMLPKISPNKTYEGAIAHVITSIIIVMLFALFRIHGMDTAKVLVVGISLSIMGQFGDLAESMLKRDAGVKDSGRHFMELGGVLDLVDSILFSMPLLYYLMRFWLEKPS